ncbi:16S rRNA (cytosine(967)-C(5))-methyltransferase [Leptolyngbya sp. AN02str]|uniref:16S rRNA (cytosine(967)-C(5))-methyltransferase n=1 Tax=Leptolyngbya sp. AN02str TaxID=3423363 RepID=UPI003D31977B
MTSPSSPSNPRHIALLALLAVQKGAFADAAVDQALYRSELESRDRSLMTELVYGCVRRQRTLDTLVAQFAQKAPAPKLRLILHLGLYQLRYLDQIPASAAVNTTVELAKTNGFAGLSGFVNGLLRQYIRASEGGTDPLQLPEDAIARLGMLHSFPDWIVQTWVDQFGLQETEALCQWFNQPPTIDLRVNPLKATVEQVQAALSHVGVESDRLPYSPQGLRLRGHVGAVQRLPGFAEGWWMVQDGSAQLVGYLLDPQPGETVIDACSAPGGKSAHLAELMGDRGVVWACDRSANRLKKVAENAQRLQLSMIQTCAGDSRSLDQFVGQGDRVLLDVPCSGLGTLHRHADARWRQSAENIAELAQLQHELLDHASTWVKPDGVLVYSTCTLHPLENEAVVQQFLSTHPDWQLEDPTQWFNGAIASSHPWLTILPHHHNLDGFFMARLRRG